MPLFSNGVDDQRDDDAPEEPAENTLLHTKRKSVVSAETDRSISNTWTDRSIDGASTTYRALAARGVLAGRGVRRRGRQHVDAHIVSGAVTVGPAAAGGGSRPREHRRGAEEHWRRDIVGVRVVRRDVVGVAVVRRRTGAVMVMHKAAGDYCTSRRRSWPGTRI